PDSFSDGGKFIAPATALERARAMIDAGVDIIDIGAESTRPYTGAQPVTAADEMARLKPVLAGVVALGLP
ncbi:dihydropteroate synthase, partial [Serratia marcescens]|uniref:dihydropteroate synthase n=1 Tax=Serratia marcescens TaxID=615 RepID=UPI0013D8E230